MADAPTPHDREPSVVRVLLGLAAIAVVLLGGLGYVAVALWGDADRAGAAPGPQVDPPADAAPADPATPAGGRGGSALTRTERLQVEAELREVERELEFVRGQARAATRPDERAGWAEQANALAARRDALRARLGR